MNSEHHEQMLNALNNTQGYIYPNELGLVWSVVIVVYPFITGLVAGAFILASLVRVFNVKALEPSYRLSLLTALAFLLVAPLPLLVHLGQPFRCYEVMMTPHLTSPMAIFGFVYAWYLMAVLLLELWFDYRKDFVIWAENSKGLLRLLYRCLTLGISDTSEKALALDHKMSRIITVIGIPSAFLLHGYVGFIFGSVKANPWWGNVLMPIIFIFSAMVSGIAMVLILYVVVSKIRKLPVDINCLATIGKFLLCALLLDAAIESLDWIHRLYEAEESIDVLVLLAKGKLFYSFVLLQVVMGTLIPLILLSFLVGMGTRLKEGMRVAGFVASAAMIVVGVFAMRWNVVIGGQLFSKSLRGFTTYKIGLVGSEGLLMSIILNILPFIILFFLIKLFLPAIGPKTQSPEIAGVSK